MSRAARIIAVSALVAGATLAGLTHSTSPSRSLQAIDCIDTTVGTGPAQQAVEICPPVTG